MISKKSFVSLLMSGLLVAVSGFALSAQAWDVAPTGVDANGFPNCPPSVLGCNPPINVSTVAQVKAGPLTVGSALPNLIANGTFDSSAGWVVSQAPSPWTIGGGVASINKSAGTKSQILSAASLVSGKTYLINFTITNYVQGGIQAGLRIVSPSAPRFSRAGTYSVVVTLPAGSSGSVIFDTGLEAATLSVDNVFVSDVSSFGLRVNGGLNINGVGSTTAQSVLANVAGDGSSSWVSTSTLASWLNIDNTGDGSNFWREINGATIAPLLKYNRVEITGADTNETNAYSPALLVTGPAVAGSAVEIVAPGAGNGLYSHADGTGGVGLIGMGAILATTGDGYGGKLISGRTGLYAKGRTAIYATDMNHANIDNKVPSPLINSSSQYAGYFDGDVVSTGKIGVGTTNPEQQLDVYGAVSGGEVTARIANNVDAPGTKSTLLLQSGGGWNAFLRMINNYGSGRLDFSVPAGAGFSFTGGNVGIGTGAVTPLAKLDVAGKIRVADGSQGNGKVLTSDANGIATWQPAANGQNISGTAGYVPLFTTANTLGNSLVFQKPFVSDPSHTYLGLGTINPTAGLEVANGYGGGSVDLKVSGRIQTGDSNGAGGVWLDNATGGFVGTVGNNIGFWTNGTGVGWNAFQINKSNGNVGIGTMNPVTKLNVFGSVGADSYCDRNGANCIIPPGTNNSTNYWTLSGAGLYNNSGSNVGIGTTNPQNKLEVNGGINMDSGTLNLPNGDSTKIDFYGVAQPGHSFINTSSGYGVNLYSGGVQNMTWLNGSVGIGTVGPDAKLHVAGTGKFADNVAIGGNVDGNARLHIFEPSNGGNTLVLDSGDKADLQFAQNGSVKYAITYVDSPTNFSGESVDSNTLVIGQSNGPNKVIMSITGGTCNNCGIVRIDGSVVSTSDVRQKKNITMLDSVLEKIKQIRGVAFNWIGEKDSDQKHLGVIAQEVEKVFPELVHTDSAGMKSVDYNGLAPVLIEAVKEQQQQIKDLQDQIKDLQVKIR